MYVHWLLSIYCFLVANCISANPKYWTDLCSSTGSHVVSLSRMFTISNQLYFGLESGQLYTLDLFTKRDASFNATDGALQSAQFVVHFDPVKACIPQQSNIDFCRLSQVWTNMVVLVSHARTGSGNSASSIQLRSWSSTSRKLVPYESALKTTVMSDSALPTVESRLHALLLELFTQMTATKDAPLTFTAATFDSSTDSLYMAATVSDESIARDSAWEQGRYVLFRGNFTPNGYLQDAFVVGKFKNPIKGLIPLNGALYGLMEGGRTILQIDPTKGRVATNDGKVRFSGGLTCFIQVCLFFLAQTYSVTDFLCNTNSPLMNEPKEPDRSDRVLHGHSLGYGLALFPHLSSEAQALESTLLHGGPYLLLVSTLAILLVLILFLNGSLIYGEISKGKNSESGPELKGTSSGASLKSSKRSPSSRKSRKRRKSDAFN